MDLNVAWAACTRTQLTAQDDDERPGMRTICDRGQDSTERTLANVCQAPTTRVTISAGLFGRAKQYVGRFVRDKSPARVEASRTHL